MIPYKISSIIRENLSNTSPYYMPNEFFNWIKYRHYPIISWTQKTPIYGKLAQYFNATSYGKWWLPINIIEQYTLNPKIIKTRLTSQGPYIFFDHRDELGWLLVDIQQAGKYFEINYVHFMLLFFGY